MEGEICLFCEVDKDEIIIKGNEVVKKDKVVNDYQIFLKMVKERNEILKNALKGSDIIVPPNIMEDE